MLRFATAIFLSAFLLFQVQPLIGRYILPWFGGGPAVWTACMLFFQALLLAGYAWAHLLARLVAPRRQPLVHAGLLALSLLFLPVGVAPSWKPQGDEAPTARILLMLGSSIAAPYALLSATGPLLQHWFRLAHPTRPPWRLYALSNLGSMLALLSYPFLFEPVLTLRQQSWSWSLLYLLFAAGVCWCGVALRAITPGAIEPGQMAGDPAQQAPSPAGPGSLRYAYWVTLSALGSMLLLATTNQLCMDVAVVPFLWVLPLMLYLLTFVICFDRERWYGPGWWAMALGLAIFGAYWAVRTGTRLGIVTQVLLYGWSLFAGCMVCHGQLVRSKPEPRHLTGFYLAMSLGGALGGAFVALAAPWVFVGHYEFQLALLGVAAAALAPSMRDRGWWPARMWPTPARWAPAALLVLACATLVWGASSRAAGGGTRRGETIEVSRNFYGILRVFRGWVITPGQPVIPRIEIEHGRVVHGTQLEPEHLRRVPTTYYGANSGVALALQAHPRRSVTTATGPTSATPPEPFRVGVVGLGAGTLATYGRRGDRFDFYEINPEVIRLAHKHFTFLRDSPASVEMHLGDARIVLERQLAQGQPGRFDVLVLDAFSGDAIPVHLLTREAAQTYLGHLREDGILAIHISNLFIDLRPVTHALAAEVGMERLFVGSEQVKELGVDKSYWVLLTRNRAFIDQPEVQQAVWRIQDLSKSAQLWTDDFSSVWRLIMKW